MPEPDQSAIPHAGPFSFQQDLELIRDVAREAGALAMHWLEKGASSWEKAPNDPVTEADIAVNDLIFRRLLDARPAYGWVSEEGGGKPKLRERKRIFIVDPIDGTRAFMRKEPGFTVCIARMDENRPVVGVVYNPSTEELYEAVIGEGARLNGVEIASNSTAELSGLKIISSAPHHMRDRTWPDGVFADPVPNSLAYRICLVADGRWDAMIALSPKCDWDLAAASLILSEAAGRCTDRHGAEITFKSPYVDQRSVVASGASVHGLIIDRLGNL